MRNFPFFQIYLKFVYLIEDAHFWLHSDDEYARPWPSSGSQEWEAVRPRNPAPTGRKIASFVKMKSRKPTNWLWAWIEGSGKEGRRSEVSLSLARATHILLGGILGQLKMNKKISITLLETDFVRWKEVFGQFRINW